MYVDQGLKLKGRGPLSAHNAMSVIICFAFELLYD